MLTRVTYAGTALLRLHGPFGKDTKFSCDPKDDELWGQRKALGYIILTQSTAAKSVNFSAESQSTLTSAGS